LASLLLFQEFIALKRNLNLEKTEKTRRAARKSVSIFSTEINFTSSSDEDEERDDLFTSSKPFSSRKNNLEKVSHPTIELVVSLIVNNEEHLLRAIADTVTRSSIILDAYTSAPFIKTDDSNTTTWSTMGGKFTTTKTGICL
jgi:hypothetical protein